MPLWRAELAFQRELLGFAGEPLSPPGTVVLAEAVEAEALHRSRSRGLSWKESVEEMAEEGLRNFGWTWEDIEDMAGPGWTRSRLAPLLAGGACVGQKEPPQARKKEVVRLPDDEGPGRRMVRRCVAECVTQARRTVTPVEEVEAEVQERMRSRGLCWEGSIEEIAVEGMQLLGWTWEDLWALEEEERSSDDPQGDAASAQQMSWPTCSVVPTRSYECSAVRAVRWVPRVRQSRRS